MDRQLFAMKVLIVVMQLLFIFGLDHSSATTISQVSKSTRLTKPPDKRVVGGVPAKSEEFPFFVLIHMTFYDEGNELHTEFCGGSIINEQWILSAAHCFVRRHEYKLNITAYASVDREYQINSNISSSRRVVAEVTHPNYDNSTNNDITLLKVSEPFKFSRRIQKINLPSYHLHEKQFKRATIIGFGKTSEKSETGSDRLMAAKIDIFQDNETSCLVDIRYNPKWMICAGVAKGGKDACQGDSGGPLIGSNSSDRIVLGVVSFSMKGCARKEYPGYYTRVSYYLNWIKKTINDQWIHF